MHHGARSEACGCGVTKRLYPPPSGPSATRYMCRTYVPTHPSSYHPPMCMHMSPCPCAGPFWVSHSDPSGDLVRVAERVRLSPADGSTSRANLIRYVPVNWRCCGSMLLRLWCAGRRRRQARAGSPRCRLDTPVPPRALASLGAAVLAAVRGWALFPPLLVPLRRLRRRRFVRSLGHGHARATRGQSRAHPRQCLLCPLHGRGGGRRRLCGRCRGSVCSCNRGCLLGSQLRHLRVGCSVHRRLCRPLLHEDGRGR